MEKQGNICGGERFTAVFINPEQVVRFLLCRYEKVKKYAAHVVAYIKFFMGRM